MLKGLLASKSRPTVVGLLIYFLAFDCEKVITTNVMLLHCMGASVQTIFVSSHACLNFLENLGVGGL